MMQKAMYCMTHTIHHIIRTNEALPPRRSPDWLVLFQKRNESSQYAGIQQRSYFVYLSSMKFLIPLLNLQIQYNEESERPSKYSFQWMPPWSEQMMTRDFTATSTAAATATATVSTMAQHPLRWEKGCIAVIPPHKPEPIGGWVASNGRLWHKSRRMMRTHTGYGCKSWILVTIRPRVA